MKERVDDGGRRGTKAPFAGPDARPGGSVRLCKYPGGLRRTMSSYRTGCNSNKDEPIGRATGSHQGGGVI